MSNFSQRLRDLRASANISQEELARRLKVTRSCIGNYEQGKREPNFEDLERIADYFNVDMSYLVGKSDSLRHDTVETLSEDESRVIRLYREEPDVRGMIDKMLIYYNLHEGGRNG